MFGTSYKDIPPSTIFNSLHSELGARISTRASINTAHIQTIMTFAGGYLFATVAAKEISNHAIYLPYAISVIIPCISYYYIALYRHNDMHIGLLNLLFRKIEEEHGSTLSKEIRFYALDGFYQDSFRARRISHRAIYFLCLLSPILIVLDSLFRLLVEQLGNGERLICKTQTELYLSGGVFLFVVAVSLYNIKTLHDAQLYRDSLRSR